MTKIGMSLVAIISLAYVGLCALLFASQRSMMYFPTAETAHSGAVRMSVDSSGESLKLWHIPGGGTRAIIYFGGNAEDVGGNITGFSAVFSDYSIYLVNYRGYGGSSGRPTESALFTDALAVFDEISPRHSEISVIGRSLGSGVAVFLASVRDVERLVLVSPFDSAVNVAKKFYPVFPVSLLLRDKYDSISRVDDVEARTLILIAEHDEVIPRERSTALADAFPAEQVSVKVIDGVTHNTLDYSPEYLRALGEYL